MISRASRLFWIFLPVLLICLVVLSALTPQAQNKSTEKREKIFHKSPKEPDAGTKAFLASLRGSGKRPPRKHPRLKSLDEALCLRCHKTVKYPTGLHPALEVSDCMSCHQMQEYPDGTTFVSFQKQGRALCQTCHAEFDAKFENEKVHSALKRGRECIACHDPHRSANPKLLHEDSIQAQCLTCHDEIGAKLESAHPHGALEMGGCETCHDPHSSTREKLLLEKIPDLCAACHDLDAALQQKHAGQDISRANCTSCHDPHGSNAQGMLIGGTVHPPFAERMCDSCHEGTSVDTSSELCLGCHDDIERHLKLTNVHPPAADSCVTCHNPHLSREKRLLQESMPGVCTQCHDSKEESFASKHGNFTPSKCTVCHNPHGSAQAALLAGSIKHQPFAEGKCKSCHYSSSRTGLISRLFESDRLCTRCHKEIGEATRQDVKHPAIDEGCTLCHSPHVADQKRLLLEPQGELCAQCHDFDDLAPLHAGANLANVTCTVCHNPHGGKHEKLLRGDVVHPPFEERMCDACHDGNDARGRPAFTEEGTDLCTGCHDEIGADMERKHPHGALEMETCTVCHTPHAGNLAKLLKEPVAPTCGQCHDLDDEDLTGKHGGFNLSGAKCTLCHMPHGSDFPKLLKGGVQHMPFAERMCDSCHEAAEDGTPKLMIEGNELCLECHDVLDGFSKSKIHSAISQRGCTGCHDQHVGKFDKQLPAEGMELCLTCHVDVKKLTQERVVHGALEMDGCATCHASPHATQNDKMLAEPVPDLCAMCHDTEDLKDAHFGQPVSAAICSACHNPHGSATDKLLRSNEHPPFEERMCDACHGEPEGTSITFQEEGNDLCLMCHDDKATLLKEKPVVHGAIETGGCIACHTPHASSLESLQKQRQPGLCMECHDDIFDNGPARHGVIELGGCTACHDPHATDNPKLLRASTNTLCMTCHDVTGTSKEAMAPYGLTPKDIEGIPTLRLTATRDYGHPRNGHPVKGRFTLDDHEKTELKLDLSCVSCHSPHSGATSRMFVKGFSEKIELCQDCHKK